MLFLARIAGLGGKLFLDKILNGVKGEVPPGRFLTLSTLISSLLLSPLASSLLLLLASTLPLLIC